MGDFIDPEHKVLWEGVKLLCAQEVVTHFMYQLLYNMGHYFLDT